MLHRINKITEKEIAVSADIVRRAFKTVADEFHLTKDNAPTNGAFLEDEKLFDEYRKGIEMFGLFGEESQIGFFALEKKENEIFYLAKLAVLPEYRHMGCGKVLTDYAIEYVKNIGCKNISIGIIYKNKPLLEWYKKLGFIETGTKLFPHLPFTVCFMRLDV